MEDRDLLRERFNAMSPEERDALNKAIRDRAAAGLAKCRKVTPNALQRFEEKIKDYPLEGKAAWLAPHRDRLRRFVVTTYACGNDEHDLTDLNILRFKLGDEALTQAQKQQLLRVAVDWLRRLDKVSSVRLSKQLNGPSGKTEPPHPLDKYKPL
jgi:hypothetical protein